MKRLLLTLLLVTSLVFSSTSQISAANEFTTSLRNEHTITEDGKTIVRKYFSIKNNLSTVYLTKYGIELSSNTITGVKTYDATGSIDSDIKRTESSTTIELSFADKVVGKDQARTFVIEYTDPDSAVLSGNILEVYVPKVADTSQFTNYATTLIVPAKFGTPSLATPATYTVETKNNMNVLSFGTEGKEEGISLIFGEQQYFDFSLKYHLHNPTANRGIMQITFPPDTPFQKVHYTEINPRPDSIESDEDGNWIATYVLESNQQNTVTASGIASIYLKPEVPVPHKAPSLSHTQPNLYWESDDPIIQNIASKHPGPKEIFDFVVDALDYNYSRVSSNENRHGAKVALERADDAVCQEYTDLFIAVARANGIPARQATGYAFTNNNIIRPLSLVKDILHAWPEYYDEAKQQWIPVDPTWASTTGGVDYFTHLDFNHFVFTYQGLSSEKPYPAGSYKIEGVESKDVVVETVAKGLDPVPGYSLTISPPLSSWFGIGTHTLKITNTTGTAWYDIPLTISTNEPNRLSLEQAAIPEILPYQTYQLKFTVTSPDWFRSTVAPVTIIVGEEMATFDLTASSQLQQIDIDSQQFIYLVGGGAMTLGVVIVMVPVYLFWRKRNRR